jgi:hypothetical protein
MGKNVQFEEELYEPMRCWLQQYLEDLHPHRKVLALDTHAQVLDSVLEKYDVISEYPQVVGVDIQIDILGIVWTRSRVELTFIEAKKTALSLHSLGQLWAYCKLCNPDEAFLLSSVGLGSLNKILTNLARTDLLFFGDGQHIKNMKIGKWDIARKAIDFSTLIPRV